MRRRGALIAVLALCAAAACWPGAAAAQVEVPNVPALAPPAPVPTSPDVVRDCPNGAIACVDRVIREMTRRFDALAAACDHRAIFALSYLRTTEEYRRAVSDPAYFADNAWVNHEDTVFARLYFEPFDAYARGRPDEVPPAWRIAFDASRDRAVNGIGSLLLGINAHVQRDLPFVLADLGLVAPDGTSRKADHDRVNAILRRVAEPLLDEIARRFDPTVDDLDVPGTDLETQLAFQLVPAWRELAWRNAERLVSAPDAAGRAAVARSIEDQAAASAHSLRLTTAYPPLGLGGGAAARDAFCATARDAAAGG